MKSRGYGRLVRWGISLVLVVLCAGALAPSSSDALLTHHNMATFDGSNGSEEPVVSVAVDNSGGPSGDDVYVAVGFFAPAEVLKFDANGAYTGVEITGAETPQGSFSFLSFLSSPVLSGIAVDSSTSANKDDVYVADIGNGVIDKFDETGHYVCQITGTETPSLSECNGVAGSKTPDGSMTPRGVAVDSSGNVYVSDVAHNMIDEFAPSGEYIGQVADPVEEPGALAIDSSGDLYVANGSAAAPTGVVELAPGGSVVPNPELESIKASSIAVDTSSGHVFAGEPGSQISEFEASGAKLDTFGEGGFALAVNSTTHNIYANQSFAPPIQIYGPLAVLPEVTTDPATEVREESATLHGHVTPDTHVGGEVTKCEFEYGVTTAYGKTALCEQEVPYPSGGDVSADVSLSSSTTYHFRLKAADAGGFNEGADETLTTPGPAGIEDESATAAATKATARTQINPFGLDTTCQVEYVDEADFKSSGYAKAAAAPCAPSDLGSGFGDVGASAPLTGLHVNTTYHYRFVATNTSHAKTTDGADATFATFGIKSFGVEVFDQEGKPYTQAGGHPYALITSFDLNATLTPMGTGVDLVTDANLKDVFTDLPPGLIGNADAITQCTQGELASRECSGAAQVGVINLLQDGYNTIEKDAPLYNLVPPAGVPVELGANIASHVNVLIRANVRTGGDYGVTAEVRNASTDAGVTGAAVELWGVPADASHDLKRQCPTSEGDKGPCSANVVPEPFLSNPTSCSGPQTAGLRVDSWQAPGEFVTATSTLPAVTGCDRLSFVPSISVLPDTGAADSPSGVLVKLHVPQNEALEGVISPSLRDAVVTLPAGLTLNPADANGLQACSQAQIGLDNASQPLCPDASKVGSVEIETPLLPDRLMGSVYLAEQNNNPFGSTFALYVVAQADGAMVKVAGKVEADPLTGQLTSSFDENPQLPFSDFRLRFFGGPRAPLATPKVCGTYTTTSSLTPWSAPESGPAPTPSIPFQITTGPGGAPCTTPGFAPGFTAGTTSNQAGGFSPFTLTMGRNDGEQNLGTVSTILPPGLVGMLSNVPLCGEPQASEGACPTASMIGHVTTGVGAGPYPLFVPQAGRPANPVFLTGPYKGAPFGLSVVVPAEAGPFNLGENGRPVVVRARVSVDPSTAQVTVTSDPLPQILKGVPLDIRSVNVTIDHPQFMLNSTSCEQMRVVGNLTSGLGTPASLAVPLQASLTVPFQVTNCAALDFKPQFKVSTSGHTSRAKGASLNVKLTYPSGALGKDANIAKVKVDLPRQLPSRLSTLQKACVDATFDRYPAACPSASRVGEATATTPIIPVPLTGPAYFVSHGGAKFPELVIVLSGYGVTVELHGETFINPKTSVTSSTFRSIPDVPVSTFELKLPQGSNSALAANGNLCSAKLKLPTAFTAQNGAVIKQTTPIGVTACAKHKKAKKRHRARRP